MWFYIFIFNGFAGFKAQKNHLFGGYLLFFLNFKPLDFLFLLVDKPVVFIHFTRKNRFCERKPKEKAVFIHKQTFFFINHKSYPHFTEFFYV